jgi:hypothetical protein
MHMTLKAVAAALLIASSGAAMADIANGETGNGELFLSVWDQVNSQSYIRDLNVGMNSFGTINRPTGGFATNVDVWTGPGTNPIRFTSMADSNWTTFLSGKSDAVIDQFVWDVIALDSTTVGSVPDGIRYLTTSGTALNWSTTTGNQQNNSSIVGFQGANAYVNAVNLTLTGDTSVGGSAIFGAGSAAYMGEGTSGKLDNFGTFARFKTTGLIGNPLDFYYITRSSASAPAEGLAVKYGNIGGDAEWLLSKSGDLTFSAPVPEPETYALMVAGLALVGVAARRRRA